MGGVRTTMVASALLLAGLAGCAGGKAQSEPVGRSVAALGEGREVRALGAVERFVDAHAGFEIARPSGDAWQFAPGHEAPEGILVPVVVLHPATGSQVVVQVTPEVAAPQEFAERLAVGLRSKPGFTTTVPADGGDGSSSGFSFSLGAEVYGRVGIFSPHDGRLFVLLATWPSGAPESVVTDVDEIMASLRPFAVGSAAVDR